MIEARRPLLFVYGTLRSDAGHPMREVVANGGDSLGQARVAGTLLRVDWYPGLVVHPVQGHVFGELWRLRDSDVFGALDGYEGCGPEDPRPHEYERQSLSVERENGSAMMASTYVFAGDVSNLEVIPSGDWLTFVQNWERAPHDPEIGQ